LPTSDQPNYLAIDYGTKRLGLAYSVAGIIFTLPGLKNDDRLITHLKEIVSQYSIVKIYVGLSEGAIADKTLQFVSLLTLMVKLPVETVEEAVSTIEATEIFRRNLNKKKGYKKMVDSVAAAVILRRVIN
jgi:putative transcription antitermination factor YqgF